MFSCSSLQRPPSSSLSYGGAMNDDVRSPGSGSTPGPLSAQPPPGLGDPDPGKYTNFHSFTSPINQLMWKSWSTQQQEFTFGILRSNDDL